ncbi:MAG: hypothetical protein KJZ52_12510, partial [Anaerolineales bacterium]|nr:hypothetical protein [Anaerolineales bacterium]
MLKRKLSAGLLLALAISLFASQAFAGSVNFNVIVPKFGGSTYTPATGKTTTVQYWQVSNIAVGAGYTVYFQPYKADAPIASRVAGTTGSYIYAPYYLGAYQPVGSFI